jgi:hypothetical protein
MPTVRFTPSQKRRLDAALKVIEGYRGRRLSRGEAIAQLADRASKRPAEFAEPLTPETPEWLNDPIFDPNFGIDMGRTDEKTVDRLLYGRR